ncbi:MAG TPA: hypothetical protein VGO53_15310, partial [Steroidobacteraceae bacterium]|nr:hypothetical protein [Steroidobacteraceae bacterium]
MKRLLRWSGLAALTVLALVVVAAAVVFIGSQIRISHRYEPHKESLTGASAALIADASRQARLLGCVSCHGEGLQGKLMADVPNVARFHAPNLTELARRATDQ